MILFIANTDSPILQCCHLSTYCDKFSHQSRCHKQHRLNPLSLSKSIYKSEPGFEFESRSRSGTKSKSKFQILMWALLLCSRSTSRKFFFTSASAREVPLKSSTLLGTEPPWPPSSSTAAISRPKGGVRHLTTPLWNLPGTRQSANPIWSKNSGTKSIRSPNSDIRISFSSWGSATSPRLCAWFRSMWGEEPHLS